MLQIKEPSFVAIDPAGRKLAYDEVSPAEPRGTILLLTGLGSKRQAWHNQLPEFGKYYRTIALDHREIGDSDLTHAPYKIADQASDAAAALRALGISKAHVVGISMGGFISLELALNYPELVQSLTLVSTSAGGATHVPPGPQMLQMLTQRDPLEPGEFARRNYSMIMSQDFLQAHPESLDIIAQIANYKPLPEAVYQRQLYAVSKHDAANRLQQLKVPTLVIHGDADPLVPYPNGQQLAAKISGAKLITYPGTGHIPIIEQAAQFNQDVLDFINTH